MCFTVYFIIYDIVIICIDIVLYILELMLNGAYNDLISSDCDMAPHRQNNTIYVNCDLYLSKIVT